MQSKVAAHHEEHTMRPILFIAVTALAFTASPAKAQVVIISGSNSPPGYYSFNSPYYPGGFAVSNGVITTFPSTGYSPFGYPGFNPYYGSPRPYYGTYPFGWRR
jgi:hypothetical protein